MAKTKKNELNDEEIGDNGFTVLKCIDEAFREADQAKQRRMRLNKRNLETYMGQQDFSHKQAGQSREFIPKTAVAVEQFSGFVKNGLIQHGNWFSLTEPPYSPLTNDEIRELLKCTLNNLADGMRHDTTFALRASDGVKLSLLEALIIFKVHGYQVPESQFSVERGMKFVDSNGVRIPRETTKLRRKTVKPWRLAIDCIRAADYYPDPTGRKLYEIHRVERDFHDVIELAEQGIYDKKVVEQLQADFDDRNKEYADALTRNQQGITPPSFRKTVVIDEYWGDILDQDGKLVSRNQVCARANQKYLIRKPEDNPYWHGCSPFVAIPLIRVPDTVWHKALFDHASPLNLALNEIFNLILDGGLASVWGIKQLRMGGLEDPRQVSAGVAQGMTLAVKDEFPMDGKVLETVSSGEVPPDALNTYSLLDREYQVASLGNDLSRGLLPAKEVRATEVVEIQQSQNITLQSIITDMEAGFTRVLELSWLTIMQNADQLPAQEIISAIGNKAALTLSKMTPAERYAVFGQGYGIKVSGLSETLGKVKEFQKLMAFQQVVMANPVLMEAYMSTVDGRLLLQRIFRMLNMDPKDVGFTAESLKQLPERVNRMAAMAQTFGMGAPGTMKTGGAAGSIQGQLPAEVNQASNPMTGMVG